MSAGFLLALFVVSFFRESLGTGSLSVFGVNMFTLPVLEEHPVIVFILPPGAFLVLALLLALLRRLGVLPSE